MTKKIALVTLETKGEGRIKRPVAKSIRKRGHLSNSSLWLNQYARIQDCYQFQAAANNVNFKKTILKTNSANLL